MKHIHLQRRNTLARCHDSKKETNLRFEEENTGYEHDDNGRDDDDKQNHAESSAKKTITAAAAIAGCRRNCRWVTVSSATHTRKNRSIKICEGTDEIAARFLVPIVQTF